MRGASHLSKRQVRRCAMAAGFGSQLDWSAVRTMEGLARYLVGYLMKSRDVFPSGTRVLVCSQGWTVNQPGEAESAPTAPAQPDGPDARELIAQATGAGARPVDLVDWYGGPPPGITWTEWADDAVMIAAGRRVLRHRRRLADREQFEALTRARWFRWQGSTNGRAAVGRLARGPRRHSVGSRGVQVIR